MSIFKQIGRKFFAEGDFLYRHRRSLPWFTLGLSLALVVGFGWLLIRYLERQDRQVMQLQAVELAASIEQRMKSSEAMMRAAATAFAFVPEIDRDFFSSYIKGLKFKPNQNGIAALGWTVPVVRERIGDLEADIRAKSGEDFYVWPVTDERLNYAILYIEPDNWQNRNVIGYNMFSDPARRAAMVTAFSTGEPQASGPVLLKQDLLTADTASGFLLYAPVFDGTRQRPGDAPSKSALRGFVFAAIRSDDLLKPIIADKGAGRLDLELYDITSGKPQLMYDSHPEIWSLSSSDSIITDLRVSGRQWELVAAPIYPWEFSSFPQRVLIYFLLGTGVIVSLLLTQLVRQMLKAMELSRRALDRQAEQIRIRSILVRELNHRVKNTLATVNSLAALSREGADDVASYYEALNGRLRALSATHDLLTSSDWGETALQDIVEAELAPFKSGATNVQIEGPPVRFDPSKALSLGLSLHELATNASKYGALSTVGGHVSIKWHIENDALCLLWAESGGPVISNTRKRGFGSVLVEKLMARQLRAEVKIDYPPEGVTCQFRIPLDKPDAKSKGEDK